MAGLIDSIVDKYNYVIHDLADPRTADWWGVSNPFVVLSITSSYLFFCKYLGPKLMENRPPFVLKTPLLLYNIFQVLFSIFLVYEGSVIILDGKYSVSCEEIDYTVNPRSMRLAGATWYYFFAKITELMDTIFFVLRKKYNQVTFLHVYHHTIMSLVVWMGVKYFPGGHTTMMGYLNSIVHVIMYSYYLISSLGPEYQKYVWWKKHVTMIQLIQFSIIFVHNAAVFFYECNFPKVLNILCITNSVAFMYMFGNFYIQSYNKNKRDKKELEAKKVTPISSKVNRESSRRKVVEKSR
ncbi:very long chain fatty acid elongase AAEL008004 [Helicoverpa armigera]|uniref:very long chain fatty acid elongase AAEL008004 n=1 Tax=Helicoverpa armigera TaxID=29058 RepID=UPI0021110CDF|nr:elongation of very long chain fatty acids protein AAEL008004 [Helicoverpa armigera]XP_021181935.2 elongation of very long chain fatty acids protein AAEL008004 [Helicoverpa armigera]